MPKKKISKGMAITMANTAANYDPKKEAEIAKARKAAKKKAKKK